VILVQPLALIVLSGVSISNLALGDANAVQILLLSSAAFNANVVSTGSYLATLHKNYHDSKKTKSHTIRLEPLRSVQAVIVQNLG
jgi:hypothetical protein